MPLCAVQDESVCQFRPGMRCGALDDTGGEYLSSGLLEVGDHAGWLLLASIAAAMKLASIHAGERVGSAVRPAQDWEVGAAVSDLATRNRD